jgi:hypothetical protein
MVFSSDDGVRFVEAHLVARRTFLHLEPQDSDVDGYGLTMHRIRRSKSDTFVHYGLDEESEDNVSTCGTSSLRSSLDEESPEQSLGHCSGSDSEEDSSSSKTSVSDGIGSDQSLPASSCSLSQQEQLYFYVAMPASTSWGIPASPMNEFSAPPYVSKSPIAAEAAAAASEALHLQAQAMKLRAEAVRLKAQALKLEAAAQSAPTSLPGGPWTRQQTLQPPSIDAAPVFVQAYGQAFVPLGQRQQWKDECTTLMLRNIPNDYTRELFLALLDSNGLAGTYNFVYLPIDFKRMSSLGYGFVNFVSHAEAELARVRLEGFNDWSVQSQKVCSVCWGEPLQGLQAHIERYRSSPVMHREVPDECRPILLQNGVIIPFPPPNRRVRAPRSTRDA